MFSIYARPEIEDVRGLKGKKIGVSSIGTGADSLLREALKKYGLDPNRDATILAIGVTPTRYAALVNGSVDATMLTPPLTFKAEDNGLRELVNFATEDLVEIQGSIVAREALLKSEPSLVRSFVRATLKGFLYARDNRSGTIPIIARTQQIDSNLARRMYDSVLRRAMTKDGTIGEDVQQKSVEHLILRLGSTKPPHLSRIFDYSYTTRSHSELQAKGWKPEP
jgi:ABC-type nitrate/sulfonate/bicarbonate transport system substrate-binding protein